MCSWVRVTPISPGSTGPSTVITLPRSGCALIPSPSLGHEGERLDLDLGPEQQPGDLDRGARRQGLAETLRPHRAEGRVVVEAGQEDGDLDHVGEARPGGGE